MKNLLVADFRRIFKAKYLYLMGLAFVFLFDRPCYVFIGLCGS